MNHGQVDVSNSMSARQLSSSGSCCGPTVPTLELSHADGRSGAGGVLVTLAAVPSLPVLSCQQLPVLPRYWSHQKSVRPVGDVPGAVGLHGPVGRPAHHVAVELVPVRGRRRHRGRVAARQQRRVDSRRPADDLVGHREDHRAAPPVVVEVVVANDVVVAARRSTGRCRRERGRTGRRPSPGTYGIEVVRVEVVVLDQVRVLREAGVAGRREDVGRESERVVVEVVVVDVGGVAVGARVAAGVVVRVAVADLLAVAELRIDARVALIARCRRPRPDTGPSRRCRRPRSSASGRGPRRT